MQGFPGPPDLSGSAHLSMGVTWCGLVCVWFYSSLIRRPGVVNVTKWMKSYHEAETGRGRHLKPKLQSSLIVTVTFFSDFKTMLGTGPIQLNMLTS